MLHDNDIDREREKKAAVKLTRIDLTTLTLQEREIEKK